MEKVRENLLKQFSLSVDETVLDWVIPTVHEGMIAQALGAVILASSH